MTIAAGGVPGHDRENGGGNGAGHGTMKGTGKSRSRSRSRDRHRATKDEKPAPSRTERQRTRSRSPARNGTTKNLRTRSPPRKSNADVTKLPITKPAEPQPTTIPVVDKMQVDPPAVDPVAPAKSKAKSKPKPKATPEEDSDPEIAQMRSLMGFAGFKTTKDTKVPGNNVYAVRKEKKTEYRQYMNRVGGFNRPLSPSR
ncbi:hypothetical protein MMC15_006354 [Xylographa vitiligo]|nr:hypothetical protein [Xylographa vitiligo]